MEINAYGPERDTREKLLSTKFMADKQEATYSLLCFLEH
jgi:hypothetical protein